MQGLRDTHSKVVSYAAGSETVAHMLGSGTGLAHNTAAAAADDDDDDAAVCVA